MPEETARLFVGIEPDEAARHALNATQKAFLAEYQQSFATGARKSTD